MSTDRESPEGEPELSEIEAALGLLAPTRGRLDRDRLMYQLGRSSIRPSPSGRRAWMAAAAVFGLVALGEGALFASRPDVRVVERLVVVREPATAPIVEPIEALPSVPLPRAVDLGPGSRDRLAWQVLRYGLDGLPAPAPSGGGDRASSRRSSREEIGKDLELGDPI